MARIYISSSWKNGVQPLLVEQLRAAGHKVYDFRHPEGREDQSVWADLGVNEVSVPATQFDQALSTDMATSRFNEHFEAMQDADTCILLLPCGRSSHVEAGFMKGLGKRVFVYTTTPEVKPELMYMVFDGYFHDETDLFEAVATPIPGVCRVCGCTEENPCWNPNAGACWWVDEEHTLCSHCARLEENGDYQICDDPNTVHCVNDHGRAFK